PLAGLRAAAARLDAPLPDITVGMRTGDTPADVRRRFPAHPHDIITTPPGPPPARHPRWDAPRRPPGRRPPPLPGPPARYPHHHPRVAVPPADVQGPRGPDLCRHGDRGRGPSGRS